MSHNIRPEGVDYLGDLPLRLSFGPDAIREHYEDCEEGDDPTVGLTDDDLAQIGEWALNDQCLYEAFHNALESAITEYRLRMTS